VQTWTNIDTRYPIYRKDVVYGATLFLIDDSRDGKQNYEARALSIFRAADGGTLLENQPVIFYIYGGCLNPSELNNGSPSAKIQAGMVLPLIYALY